MCAFDVNTELDFAAPDFSDFYEPQGWDRSKKAAAFFIPPTEATSDLALNQALTEILDLNDCNIVLFIGSQSPDPRYELFHDLRKLSFLEVGLQRDYIYPELRRTAYLHENDSENYTGNPDGITLPIDLLLKKINNNPKHAGRIKVIEIASPNDPEFIENHISGNDQTGPNPHNLLLLTSLRYRTIFGERILNALKEIGATLQNIHPAKLPGGPRGLLGTIWTRAQQWIYGQDAPKLRVTQHEVDIIVDAGAKNSMETKLLDFSKPASSDTRDMAEKIADAMQKSVEFAFSEEGIQQRLTQQNPSEIGPLKTVLTPAQLQILKSVTGMKIASGEEWLNTHAKKFINDTLGKEHAAAISAIASKAYYRDFEPELERDFGAKKNGFAQTPENKNENLTVQTVREIETLSKHFNEAAASRSAACKIEKTLMKECETLISENSGDIPNRTSIARGVNVTRANKAKVIEFVTQTRNALSNLARDKPNLFEKSTRERLGEISLIGNNPTIDDVLDTLFEIAEIAHAVSDKTTLEYAKTRSELKHYLERFSEKPEAGKEIMKIFLYHTMKGQERNGRETPDTDMINWSSPDIDWQGIYEKSAINDDEVPEKLAAHLNLKLAS